MVKGKVDLVKLSELLRSGKNGKQCAEYFGVTKGAISQARKGLNISVVKSVALESAHRVVDKHLNAVDQLRNINHKANDLLELAIKAKDHGTTLKAMAEIRGQLNLQLEIFKTLYDLEAVAEFQRSVLETIGEVAPDVRERIIRSLKESRSLRQSVEITGTTI